MQAQAINPLKTENTDKASPPVGFSKYSLTAVDGKPRFGTFLYLSIKCRGE